MNIGLLSERLNIHELGNLVDKLLIFNNEAAKKPLQDDVLVTIKNICSQNSEIVYRNAHDPHVVQAKIYCKILVASNEIIMTERKGND
jgi:hypothetical protein